MDDFALGISGTPTCSLAAALDRLLAFPETVLDMVLTAIDGLGCGFAMLAASAWFVDRAGVVVCVERGDSWGPLGGGGSEVEGSAGRGPTSKWQMKRMHANHRCFMNLPVIPACQSCLTKESIGGGSGPSAS